MKNSKPFWETGYKDIDFETFGNPSDEIIDLTTRLKSKKISVLDIGCGEGRNAIYLAQHGFQVDAFDISESGIKKLKKIAKKMNVSINAWVEDVQDYKFSKKYDFVIAHGILHFLKPNIRKNLLENMKKNTTPNGVNVVVVFTDKVPIPDDLKPFCLGIFKEGEIRDSYNDWEIEMFKRYVFNDEHGDNIKHTHATNKIVAWNK